MALLKKEKNYDAEVPSGSLADIAFLILIFFMVATTIDMDKGIGIVLPPKGEEQEINKNNITNVIIDPKGIVFLDEKEYKISEVKSAVEKMLMTKPKMIFSVKTLERTKYDDYVKVLDQMMMANASKNISIAQ